MKNAPLRPISQVSRIILSSGFILVICNACTEVAPWERGNLAKPLMAKEPFPLQSSVRAHMYESREAASGSASSEGGGCGCY